MNKIDLNQTTTHFISLPLRSGWGLLDVVGVLTNRLTVIMIVVVGGVAVELVGEDHVQYAHESWTQLVPLDRLDDYVTICDVL